MNEPKHPYTWRDPWYWAAAVVASVVTVWLGAGVAAAIALTMASRLIYDKVRASHD